jgi:uncharacterized protein
MAHPNEELLSRGYAAYNTGDMDTIQALFGDDIVWHAGGSNPLAGEYHGFQEIMGFFRQSDGADRRHLPYSGTFRIEVHDILANDTHGVVLSTFYAARDGQTMALRVADTWHLADGKATEHWSFFEDQAAADKLFS